MRKKETTVLCCETRRPASREKQFEKTHARTHVPSCIGAQTYSSETHSEGSHVCRHQQGVSSVDPCREHAPPFLQPNEVLGGDFRRACNSCNIYGSHRCGWVVRGPYEGPALLGLWVTAWQKRHTNPDRTALRRGCVSIFWSLMGITA